MHALSKYLNEQTHALFVNTRVELEAKIPTALYLVGNLLEASISKLATSFYSITFIKLPNNPLPLNRNKLYCTAGDNESEALVDLAYALTLANGYIVSSEDLTPYFKKLNLQTQPVEVEDCNDFVWVKSKNKPKEIIIPRGCVTTGERKIFKPVCLEYINNKPKITGDATEIRYAKGKIKPVFESQDKCLEFHKQYISECTQKNPLIAWEQFSNQSEKLCGLPLSDEYSSIVAKRQANWEKFSLPYPVRLKSENLFWVIREGETVTRESDGADCKVKKVTYKSDSEPPIVEIEVPDEPIQTK